MPLHAGVELRQFRYFVAVADTLNFTRAAARLRLTQPALSRQVRLLEEELGCALFVREGSRVALTSAGTTLLRAARDVLASVESFQREARGLAAASAVLRIGYFSPVGAQLTGGVLRRLRREMPRLRVQFSEMVPGQLAAALDAHELDLAIVGHVEPEFAGRHETLPLMVLPLLLALPVDHPLAKRRKLDLALLRDESFIGYAEKPFPGRTRVFEDAARAAGFTARIVRRVDELDSMLIAVSTGEGIGFGAPYLRDLKHHGVVFSEVKSPPLQITLHAAWNRGPTHPGLIRFIEMLRASAKEKRSIA